MSATASGPSDWPRTACLYAYTGFRPQVCGIPSCSSCWCWRELASATSGAVVKERSGFNLDLWADVRDESVEDAASRPAPEVIAEEIVENLTSALVQFQAVAEMLSANGANGSNAGAGGDAVSELLPGDERRI